MRRPSLIVVSGPPGAGKSTLARRIGDSLGLPVVSRDAIKEGVAYTTDEVVQHGTAAAARLFEVFYEIVDLHLERGISVVVDAAFRSDVAPGEILERTHVAQVLVIRCLVEDRVWFERFQSRGNRPGHRDWEFVARVQAGDGPSSATYLLEVPGVPVLEVDTSDGYNPRFEAILAAITAAR